jgi:hypothetical protein
MTRCSHHSPSHDGTVYRCDREATEPGGVCGLHGSAACFLCGARVPLADVHDHVCLAFRRPDAVAAQAAAYAAIATPTRIVRLVATWTPEARAMLILELAGRWPDALQPAPVLPALCREESE